MIHKMNKEFFNDIFNVSKDGRIEDHVCLESKIDPILVKYDITPNAEAYDVLFSHPQSNYVLLRQEKYIYITKIHTEKNPKPPSL